jgi:hypothetical protein
MFLTIRIFKHAVCFENKQNENEIFNPANSMYA